jgi:hypothetical protein
LWEGFHPPPDLAGEALAEYHRLVGALRQAGVLSRCDPGVVVTGARVRAMLERVARDIDRSGLLGKRGTGSTATHPNVMIFLMLSKLQRGLWADMGLVPSTARHGTPAAVDEASPFRGLLGMAP